MADLNWKNWVIGALWIVTLGLVGAGYRSIDKSISSIYDCQTKQMELFAEYKLAQEKERGMMWRVIDKLCHYQTDRLNKEGKTPVYIIPEHR